MLSEQGCNLAFCQKQLFLSKLNFCLIYLIYQYPGIASLLQGFVTKGNEPLLTSVNCIQ